MVREIPLINNPESAMLKRSVPTSTHDACRGGAIQLELLGNPFIGSASQHVAVSGAGARKAINLRAGERRRWTLPLRPAGETCTITFQTSPLISPDALIGNGDVRELGVRVIDFRFLGRAG